MPVVFLAAVAAAIAYLLHVRRAESSSLALAGCSPTVTLSSFGWRTRLEGIRGWVLLYVVALAAELTHGLALFEGLYAGASSKE